MDNIRTDDIRTPEKFTLHCERREDGGMRVWSSDVAGLVLSGADPRAVMRDVIVAVDAITRHKTK
jgi:hypothetical protein